MSLSFDIFNKKFEFMSNINHFYKIETWENNKILRKKSEKIDKIDRDLLEFAGDLLEIMYENDWVGLAAPQIWKNIRMVAITFWKEWKKWPKLVWEDVMINPMITEKSNDMETSQEACLSLPDIVWKVKRHKNIVVKYKNIEWRTVSKKLKDYNSFIVQHELDHLDGILFVDRMIK